MKNRPEVVIIEDDRAAQLMLIPIIELLGFDARVFESGGQATEYFKRRSESDPMPYAIVSDLMMDGGDGIDLLGELRCDERYQKIPFIFVSGASIEIFQDLLAPFRIEAFIVKPIRVEKIRTVFERLKLRDDDESAA